MNNTSTDLIHANGLLTDEQVRSVAPAVFATHRDESSTSERYSFLPTSEIVKPLRDEGWQVVGVNHKRSQFGGADQQSFGKHMVVLAHSRDLENYSYSKVCPRIILTNSHDGGSKLLLQAGLFRAACANGLIIADGTIQSQAIRHSNATIERAILAAIYLRDRTGQALERVEQFSARTLDAGEQIAFASEALDIRFGDEVASASPAEILQARRLEDKGDDLWHVFNRVQENIVKGGFLVTRPVEGWQVRQQRAKEIKGIDTLVGVNTALWAAADGLVLPS